MPLTEGFVMTGFWPPTIFKSMVDGRSYAVSGGNWVEIDADVTFEEVRKSWKRTGLPELHRQDNEWPVIGSKGDKYTVKLINNRFSCNCQGYGWRHRCNHIEKIQKKLEDEKNN